MQKQPISFHVASTLGDVFDDCKGKLVFIYLFQYLLEVANRQGGKISYSREIQFYKRHEIENRVWWVNQQSQEEEGCVLLL